jgi:predicted O-linked N-acetylglucosamine transferase (SPINDLY family)
MDDRLEQAIRLHWAGRLDEAEQIYRAILVTEPRNAGALHYLGLARAARGDIQNAGRLIAQSLDVEPGNPETHFHYAMMLENVGRVAEAASVLERALALAPDFVEAVAMQARLLLVLFRIKAAVEAYDRLLTLQPDYPGARYGRGYSLMLARRLDEALAAFEACPPDMVEAMCGRGMVLTALGRHDESLQTLDAALARNASFVPALDARAALHRQCGRLDESMADIARALALSPDYPAAHKTRAMILLTQARTDEALNELGRAIALDPRFVEALNIRAELLHGLGRMPESLADSDQAIAIAPEQADGHRNRASALLAMARPEEALQAIERALAIEPDSPHALANRAGIYRLMGHNSEAVQDYGRVIALLPEYGDAAGQRFYAKALLCDWSARAEDAGDLARRVREGQVVNPWIVLMACDDPELQLRSARQFAPPAAPAIIHGARSHQRLRIGYMTPDFRDHALALQTADLFENHDRSNVETFGISLVTAEEGVVRARLRAGLEHFDDVQGLSDSGLAAFLQEREIDILVDLAGHTANARTRALANHPVPVIASYCGYAGTMGAPYIDYLIADGFVIPAEAEAFYSEKIVRLPGCFFPTDGKRPTPGPVTRAEMGLPEDGMVFCAFNNGYKITPEIFDVWMRVMARSEGSVLWLSGRESAMRPNLVLEAQARGISADRLIFADLVTYERHFARQVLADLFLDTLPYNAHTTANDALFAGVPVVTCAGRSFAARVAGSMLSTIGLDELITHDLTGYEALLHALVQSPARLADVRRKLARNRAVLFDTARLARGMEQAFAEMWAIHQNGDTPRHISVS